MEQLSASAGPQGGRGRGGETRRSSTGPYDTPRREQLHRRRQLVTSPNRSETAQNPPKPSKGALTMIVDRLVSRLLDTGSDCRRWEKQNRVSQLCKGPWAWSLHSNSRGCRPNGLAATSLRALTDSSKGIPCDVDRHHVSNTHQVRQQVGHGALLGHHALRRAAQACNHGQAPVADLVCLNE